MTAEATATALETVIRADDLVEAIAKAIYESTYVIYRYDQLYDKSEWRRSARAAIAAIEASGAYVPRSAVADMRERAAKVAEEWGQDAAEIGDHGQAVDFRTAALAIRSLPLERES